MVDVSNWERARDWIMQNIASRALTAGDRLPPEAQIQREIGVGRHSLRRAVATLAAEGVLSVEQGRGTFVRETPRITYRIGARTRFKENLARQGVTPRRDMIDVDVLAAEPEVARALGLQPGTEVHRVLRRGYADARPLILTCSFHPAARFPDFGERRMAGESDSDIYAHHGITDYARHETAIFARLPAKWEARLLEQPADQPVVVITKIDADLDGVPIGHSEAIWAAGRVRFELDHGSGRDV